VVIEKGDHRSGRVSDDASLRGSAISESARGAYEHGAQGQWAAMNKSRDNPGAASALPNGDFLTGASGTPEGRGPTKLADAAASRSAPTPTAELEPPSGGQRPHKAPAPQPEAAQPNWGNWHQEQLNHSPPDELVKNPDGSLAGAKWKDGETETFNPTGAVHTWANGETETNSPSGNTIHTWPDGRSKEYSPTAHETIMRRPNGESVTILPDGTAQHRDPRGVMDGEESMPTI